MGNSKKFPGRMAQELLNIRRQIADLKKADTIQPDFDERCHSQDTQTDARVIIDSQVQFKERIVELGLTNNDLLQEVNRARKTKEELQKQVSVLELLLEQRVTELQKAYSELESEHIELKTSYEGLEAARRELSLAYNGLEQLNSQLEREKKKLENTISGLQKEIDNCRQSYDINVPNPLKILFGKPSQWREKVHPTRYGSEIQLETLLNELLSENNALQQKLAEIEKLQNPEGQLSNSDRQASSQETQMKERLDVLKSDHPWPEIASADSDTAQALVEISPDGIIVNWGVGAEKICGYSSHEVTGFPFSILVPRKSYEDIQKILLEARQGLETVHTDTILVRKDGEQVNVSIAASPLKDRPGNDCLLLFSTTDSDKFPASDVL